MKIVIFGLSISSSWGNGHATIWRGLCKALAARGHSITFFEKDTLYYREHRDLEKLSGCNLLIYDNWDGVQTSARRELTDADVGIVTSYCPDALPATREVLDANCLHVFYDLDTPVTLSTLEDAGQVAYIGARGFRDFDLVFSFTGGPALTLLKTKLGARAAVPLYGSVDPEVHIPLDVQPVCDLSYLGTYAADRQDALVRLFLEPARRRPDLTFALGGAQYPQEFPWTNNIFFRRHLAPSDHSTFYCSSRLTLNITRASMAAMGYCPSGRLFEAAACGVPIITDRWDGLSDFYEFGTEIIPVDDAEDVLAAIRLSSAEKLRIGRNARERTLAQHTAAHRALEMECALEQFMSQAAQVQTAAAVN